MLVRIRLGGRHAVIVRTGVLAGSAVIAFGLLGSSATLAQNCGPLFLNGVASPGVNANYFASAALSGSTAVSAALAASNAAFMGQSAAFVSAPGNPKPNSEGAGIWIRGAGGEMTLNSDTQVGAKVVGLNAANQLVQDTFSKNCNLQFHQTFGGFQLGSDMAKLNVGGWNLTLGSTAGFLQTNGNNVGGLGNASFASLGNGDAFNANTQAPFAGMYGTATYGNFFAEGLVRADYFQTTLNSPSANIFNQKIDAHGFTAAASTGYYYKIPNSSWFVEPSAGVIWSREAVDPFTVANQFLSGSSVLFSGTTQVNDIESIIGRAGLRVGTTLDTGNIVYSPFAAASVWHDFGNSITATYATCPACFPTGMGNVSVNGSVNASVRSSNSGTFGQYSLGVSGQLKNTGWIGFARVDYRDGSQVQGLSGSGGIRYQFNPTATAIPLKAKAPADQPVDWTGWYGGLVGGATEFGAASQTFPNLAPPGVQAFAGPSTTANMRPSGWLGGGTLGYNYQIGKWVAGVEGDIAGTSTNGATSCTPLFVDPNTGFSALQHTTCRDSVDWVATATGRLGYALTPRSLFYVKAGGAFTEEKASVQCNFGSTNVGGVNLPGVNGAFVFPFGCNDPTFDHFIYQASTSAFRAGWTIGIGSEFALTNHWSIKGEFDWLDFGSKSLILSDGTPFNSTLRIAEAKIGINYKFLPAGPDSAADLAVPPAVKAAALPVKAAPAGATTWDGFYVGGSAGWEETSSKWNTTCFAFNGNCGAGNTFFADASNLHVFDTSRTRIGAYFGINWQVAHPWLVGVEADVGFNDETSAVTGIVGCTMFCGRFPGLAGHTSAFDSTSVRTSWDGSLRARAGYVVTPAFLVYGTGGFAERMIDANVTCNGVTSAWCSQLPIENQTYASHLQAGWTAGGGIEWKVLNNVLLRGEYRYSDYGSWSPTFFAGTVDEIRTNISSQTHMVLFGASYLFGGTPVK